ncbi:MAG: phosphatase PAP2 family protein [Candidatus Nealsonbacteria bacterium]|nr:phosphatase PAP2 family protein [Candidatus Nealsonbacteria bacterium]
MQYDTKIILFLNDLVGRSAIFDGLILFFTSYVQYFLVAALFLFLFYEREARRTRIEILLTTIISVVVARFGVTSLIRLFYNRPRPFITLPVNNLFSESGGSFPSGHASFFFSMSAVVYIYNKAWGLVFFIATVFMGLGRVMAGVHYFSDVVGGMVVGTITAYIVFILLRKLETKI